MTLQHSTLAVLAALWPCGIAGASPTPDGHTLIESVTDPTAVPRGGDLYLISNHLTIDGSFDPPMDITGHLYMGGTGEPDGNYGASSLTIINGGSFTCWHALLALSFENHAARLSVIGTDSRFLSHNGINSVVVSDCVIEALEGASIETGGGISVTSRHAGSLVDIRGSGSRFDVGEFGGDAKIGWNFGSARVEVRDGGRMSVGGSLLMGDSVSNLGASGSALISGQNSEISLRDHLVLGGGALGSDQYTGRGFVRVEDAASLCVGGSVQVFSTTNDDGDTDFLSHLVVTDQGSTLGIDGDLLIWNGLDPSRLEQPPGFSVLAGASARVRGQANIGSMGETPSAHAAVVRANGPGSSIVFEQHVDVWGYEDIESRTGLEITDGASVQAASVTCHPSGVLTVELSPHTLAGAAPLEVADLFHADGSFVILLGIGFTPEPGQVFDLLDFARVDGAFDSIVLPEGPFNLDTSDLLVDGTVTVTKAPSPCNDADLDVPFGQLNITDVLAFLSAFEAHDPSADLAGPTGTFDFDDVLTFLAAFGAGCP